MLYNSGQNLLDRTKARNIITGGTLDLVLPAGTYYVRINYPIIDLLKAIIYKAEFYYDGVFQTIDADIVVYK